MDFLLNVSEARRSYAQRQQDLNFRRLERLHLRIDDVRRLVDKRTEQLKAISGLAALIAGFEMVVLVESNFDPDGVPDGLLVAFGFTTAVVVRQRRAVGPYCCS